MTVSKFLGLLMILLLGGVNLAAAADSDVAKEIKDLKKRIQKLEVGNAKDRVDFTGDLRVEAHTITGTVPDYFDGMRLQELMTGAKFYMEHPDNGGAPPASVEAIDDFIAQNYGDYLYFASNLTFAEVKQMVTSLAVANPAMLDQMMGMFLPAAFKSGYPTDNDILYTTRLRLDMNAKVADNISFAGRLAMYKPWGASTAIPLFNGQANTLAMDASSPGVPGGESFRVERAYFTWRNIAGRPAYLSLGRRPSTSGPPLHLRHDEPRAGTPLGTIIDFQFDGATFGYDWSEETVLRACYGMGYESQWGNASMLTAPENRLRDSSFFGFNIDAWNTEEMQVQATVARAFNLTDGFNGYIILPNNPVTGQEMPGPIVTRFNPSVNLGDFDLASILFARRDGPVDWFLSGSWSKSRPENDTGPFGGLLTDPYGIPEEQTGSMYYVGARYNFNEDRTKLGLEWNEGSKYWFNFAPSQDDLIGPKTSTRGTVIEGYLTHRVSPRFGIKLAYINYNYDYTGSGWHVGEPKDLDQVQIQGFPTYKEASKLSLGFTANF